MTIALRTVRIRAGYLRAYLGGNLVGTLEHTPGAAPRGGPGWVATPAHWAWTLGDPAQRPADELVAPLPGGHRTKDGAANALLDHLRTHRARALTDLENPAHAQ